MLQQIRPLIVPADVRIGICSAQGRSHVAARLLFQIN